MLCKRIIACLDVKDGRTVKGTNFHNLLDVGEPVALAEYYCSQGVDELVFLDISASQDRRSTMLAWVQAVAKVVDVPFAVGGGIDHIDTAEGLLRAGADKLCLNTAALNRPELISEISQQLGNQSVVIAIDAHQIDNTWWVYSHGGGKKTPRNLFEWALEAQDLGAGEIMFTSMDHDGTGNGFALDALKKLCSQLQIPVIASGGAGQNIHFKDVFLEAEADAALAAGIFHRNEVLIPDLKQYLDLSGIPIRLTNTLLID